MTIFDSGLPFGWDLAGVVVGFLFSLLIFSFVLRESFLVRLGLYLLMGVSLGYVAILTWQSVLLPRLFLPLIQTEWTLANLLSSPLSSGAFSNNFWALVIPLLLGLIIWLAGVDYLLMNRPPRAWLRWTAMIPLGLLAGVGLGVAVAGAIQGTLVPQFLRAAEVGPGRSPGGEGPLLMGFALVITAGALLYLQGIGAEETGQGRGQKSGGAQRGWLALPFHWLLTGWSWIGQRALWLAAGFLFGQLFISRTTLLVERLLYFLYTLPSSDLWPWLAALFGGVSGGGGP